MRALPTHLLPATSAINAFLCQHELRIATNPAISPDWCLDWPSCALALREHRAVRHAKSRVAVPGGELVLAEDAQGDHALVLSSAAAAEPFDQVIELGAGVHAAPASYANLLRLKNVLQEHDATSTVFPAAAGSLAHSSIGVGARFTTLHWPAVEWAMAQLGVSLTANQNSIPRELVFDVDAMLAGKLDSVPFPFIGGNVPEGHQGQSVEGMSAGAVLSKLKTGFHRRGIAWGFNADHQPVGGKFDAREDRLVAGCLLASYITFDLSPELAGTPVPHDAAAARAIVASDIAADVVAQVRSRVAAADVALDEDAFALLLATVWPAVRKMQIRDGKYAAARAAAFTTERGRAYFRELSIDELPGLTTPATLATMLALCEALGMRIHFVAPAFGFQKNFPFADQALLERRVRAAHAVCSGFGVSIGFHSGSGKSAENYRLCGRITGSRLEIKTSGRYTYEMGRALAASRQASDQALWRDWHAFTRELAAASAFSINPTEQTMARQFIEHALRFAGRPSEEIAGVFASPAACRRSLEALTPDPDHMFWFEYNFLFVLAARGRTDKSALGDHGPDGYRQRARFYAISQAAQLAYAQRVADYLCFLCETTGLASRKRVAAATAKLNQYRSYAELVADIGSAEPAQRSAAP